MEFWDELAEYERMLDEEEERRWAEHEADLESQERDLDRFWSETRGEMWV